MRHLGDITKIDWSEVPTVDVVTGGSPCQDLSVAGKRAGLAGERSGLFMEQIRCVKELRQKDERTGRSGVHVRPRHMVWENVPGATNSGNPKGSDFAAVLEEIVKIVEPEAPAMPVPDKGWPTAGCLYDELGRWSVAWRVHDAQFWGVPQRRKRITLVADFGGLSAPEVLFERNGLSWNSESCGETREGIAGEVEGGAGSASGALNPWDSQTARVYEDSGVWHSLSANEGGGQSGDAVLTERTVCCNIGGYYSGAWLSDNPHSGVYEANVSRTLDALNCGAPTCNQGGTAVVEDVTPINTMVALRGKALGKGTGFGVGEPGDAAYTISAAHSHAVAINSVKAIHQNASGAVMESDVGYTLGTTSNASGRNTPLCYDARGNGDGQTVCTLTGDHQNRVTDYTALCLGYDAYNQAVTGDVAKALTHAASDADHVPVMYVGNANMCGSAVRRLTPLECERLQGFPDGWTDIGDWVDNKGKQRKCSDTARYKALGNSIALPFWKVLARRIGAQYDRDITMGSLFDGIGGFPLVFEQTGAKAVWASEIEEFPIAVTKARFDEG